MKKILLLALICIPIGVFGQRRFSTLKPYTFTLAAGDTMYVIPADKSVGVVVSVPNWATDSTSVSGLTGTSEDGHSTSAWVIAPGENVYFDAEDYKLDYTMDSLIIIPSDAVRVGLFKR